MQGSQVTEGDKIRLFQVTKGDKIRLFQVIKGDKIILIQTTSNKGSYDKDPHLVYRDLHFSCSKGFQMRSCLWAPF